MEFAQYIHARRKILVGVIICSGVLLSKEVYFFLKKYTYVEISTPGSTPNSITSRRDVSADEPLMMLMLDRAMVQL